jgi:RHS repeat-associated protein
VATNYPFLTLKERDIETGLDYFGARYYSSTQGRFTGADNPGFSNGTDPQTWNLYAYTANNPLRRIDPDGHDWFQIGTGYGARFEWHEGKEYKYKDADGNEQTAKNVGTHLLVYEITGTNSDEATVGKLILYEQNKVVAQNDQAFSGGDPSSLPTGEYPSIPVGVYTIVTGDRSVAKKVSDLENVYGLQEIEHKGAQGPWGTKRARLNEWNKDLPIEYRGNFLHGRKKDGDFTAGCICDRGETVLDALFKINHKVTPRVKVVVTDGSPREGDKTPGPYVIKP